MFQSLIFLGYFVFLHVILSDVVQSHSTKACTLTRCKPTEDCVNRKFWCKNPPCPRMLYCSKTRRESLKGPRTCESVRCSKGYICHVRFRQCRWDQRCEHQIARCVSELEYYHGPASCADFHCSSGYQCILKESVCADPPCKLLKSCAIRKDVQIWHSRCRTLGCPSEYECFLRKPPEDCSSTNSCKHTPDCTVTNANQYPVDSYCRGWVCPRHQECSALTPKFCKLDDGIDTCEVNRTCHDPLSTLERTLAHPRPTPWAPTAITSVRAGKPQTENPETPPDYQESYYHRGNSSTPTAPTITSMQGVIPNITESIVNSNGVEEGKYPRKEQPGDRSITQWLDDLRLKTGVDAIKVWEKHAEQNTEYEKFMEWLTAVKTTFGRLRFEMWLEEIWKLTTEYPAFQNWLPVSSSIEYHVRNGNGTERDVPKILDNRTSPTSPLPESNKSRTSDELTKTLHDAGKSPEKLWAWRYDGVPHDTQSQEEFGDQQLEEWLGNSAHSQPSKMPEVVTETTTIPILNIPKQPYRGTVRPILNQGVPRNETDVAQFRREMNFYPLVQSENERSIFSLPQESSNQPAKKNVGHPRINYGRSPAAELRNGTSAWYRRSNSTDHLRTHKHKTNKNYSNTNNVGYPLGIESPVDPPGELQKNMWANSRLQVSTDLDKFKDPNVSFNNSANSEGNANDHTLEISEYNQGQHYEGVLAADVGIKNKDDRTTMYTLIPPAADGLRTISPWDALRVFYDGKRTYNPMGFSPERVNEELQLISLQSQHEKQNVKDQEFPNSDAIVEQQIPRELAKGQKDLPDNRLKHMHSLVAPNERTGQLPRVLLIDGRSDPIQRFLQSQTDHTYRRMNWILRDSVDSNVPTQQEDYFEQQPPLNIQNVFEKNNQHEWHGRTPQRLSEVSRMSFLDTSLPEERFQDYPSTLNSQEYVDAYVDALIEDALSEMIPNEQLEKGKSSAYRMSNNLYAVLDKRLDGQYVVGTIQEAQRITTTPNPSSIITEIDDRHECGNSKTNPPSTKGLTIEKEDNVGEYDYSANIDQQEYFESSLGYQDEYLGDIEIDLANYDFQYYYDKEKVMLTKNDEMEKVSQVES